ncbi:MAG: 2'-deoxycytidine 5'-triphosphate deaminase [Candidatus Symbiobacter sp.]|nr:2'-deoxycytidine 5'-triphosphate deaminase [Candidatus Symbiobacter sp.]
MSYVLPSQELRKMIADGKIFVDGGSAAIEDSQIQPASLDLRLGNKLYEITASFLPRTSSPDLPGLENEEIENDTIFKHNMVIKESNIPANKGIELECGKTYVIPLLERVKLPEANSMIFNPKSSTGRLDVFARVICQKSERFDIIPPGYQGKLWVELSPRSFSIKVHRGSRLVQGRLKTKLNDKEIKEELVQLDALGNKFGSVIGYRAKKNTPLIDLEKIGFYDIYDFWEPILSNKTSSIILDPSEFYILVSKENVVIPPDYAAELAPISTDFGEFRVHYAGFFDPGFGWSADGKHNASRAVLEVRAHNVPFRIEHGQTVGKLMFEPLLAKPDMLYGQELKSNYQGQGLKLSKHFKP